MPSVIFWLITLFIVRRAGTEIVEINPRKKIYNKRIKDPKGGLTAYGRKYFKKKYGNNLKAGVRKFRTKQDKIRWARWATRFYNRKKIPKLVKNGKLTRYALMAHAWGVKPPRTIKEARKIGKRGARILKQFRKR